ncbi:hypothetical protein C0J52_27984 [Blattella germanica]|nr:hypothetical protein C0J52_27984 [Blattella germanica]
MRREELLDEFRILIGRKIEFSLNCGGQIIGTCINVIKAKMVVTVSLHLKLILKRGI